MEDSNEVSWKEDIVDVPLRSRSRSNKKEWKQEASLKKKVTEKSAD